MSWNEPDFFEYTVQSGDNLWDLADEFELSVDDIIEANADLDPDTLSAGQIILIPNDSELNTSQRPGERPDFRRPRPGRPYRRYRPYGCRRPYIVRPGDTLYRISYRFGIPVRSIIEFNPYINFNYPLQIGETICLP